LRLHLDGTDLTVRPGHAVRIGRAPDNDLITAAPTVSRHHAVLRVSPGGWEFENSGSAPSFLGGQQVTRVIVDRPMELTLGSADGPVLRAEPQLPPMPAAGTPPTGGSAWGEAAAWGAGVAAASGGWGSPGPYVNQYPGPNPGAPWPGGPAGPPVPGWGPPRPPGHPGGMHGDELGAALRILFPIQSWLHDRGWRQSLRLLVIAYALLPLVFLAVLSSSNNLSSPGWAYSLYIAPLWITGFWLLIRPGHVAKQEIWAAVGISAWALVWINLVTININDALNIRGSIGLVPALVIGFNEEITKALPVLLAGYILLKYRSLKLNPRMAMFLGTISGLTFGIAEQAFYTSSDIVGINQAQSANEAVNAALAFAERIFVDGFQHAVWAGIAGFFIGMALNYPRRRVQLILLGIATPAILHALNDFLAGDSVWLVIIVQAASLLLFLGYTMSAAAIEQRVRESPLFRGDSLMLPAFRDPALGDPGLGIPVPGQPVPGQPANGQPVPGDPAQPPPFPGQAGA
jgi:RsiW-degrading membrane proteinase PrsW (M82 family)